MAIDGDAAKMALRISSALRGVGVEVAEIERAGEQEEDGADHREIAVARRALRLAAWTVVKRVWMVSARRATLAARDAQDFERCGIGVLGPRQ